MVKGFKYYREGWPIRSIIIQHLANSKKRWNEDLKVENAEIRRPNREAIAAYKASLGAKSGKSKEEDTESSEEEPELDDDEEKLDFDVLDIEDDNDKDDADLDMKVDEEDAKASGNEIDSDEDEDEASEENIEPVNTISILLLPLHLIV